MNDKDLGEGFLDYLKKKDELQRQGAQLLKSGKFDELIALCDNEFRQNPQHSSAEAWMLKGAALRRKRQFKEAFECLDKALKNSLMNWQALEEMAYLHMDINNIPQAIHAFEGTIEWQLTMLGTIQPHILYNMGTCYERIANFEKAIEYYDKCLMAQPMDPNVWLHKAMAQKLSGKIDNALQSFKKVLQLQPYSEIAQAEIKLLMHDMEHKDLAALKNQIYLRDGGSSTFQIPKDYNTAEKIELPPDKMNEYKTAKVNIRMNHGVSMHELGGGRIAARDEIISLDKAIEQSDIVLKLVPYDLEVILEKGKALIQLKKFNEAIQHFDDSLKLESKLSTFMQISDNYYKNTVQEDIDKKIGLVWLYKARVEEEIGKLDDAFISYKKAKEYSDKLLPKVKVSETPKRPVKKEFKQVNPDIKFCVRCGNKLPEKSLEILRSKGEAFCPSCGAGFKI